ncbi:MAG: M1 family metallopeptidase [Deltaproteobacteria bacterium]|nr:M1 family metallopeptidase [Deltaproteobacteria bacterium]
MGHVKPISYKIRLEPDLNRFRFEGTAEISVEAIKPIGEITLNILGLAIWACQVKVGGSRVACPFSVEPKKEEVKILLPEEMTGKIDLKIQYVGEINDKMAGFYRSKYVEEGKERYMALTQFEESDARRAFPCFDHPVRKATFDVELIIDEQLVAISNTPIVEETPAGDGRKLVRFERTPRMSTYLLFFAVGSFEFIEEGGEVLVRVATMPGRKEHARFALEFGRKALEFSENYYGIRYPLPKLDLIAISDFAAGAMENWGAITFRENLLLHYPGVTSKSGEERICEVIAHEIAHQWFGNLVTPSDWKYLWLNESFATHFGYKIVAHYYPGWEVWDQFLQGETSGALERDALRETFPIEIPGGEHVVINASTAPIIYSKGGSILRQVEAFVGREQFREGLRRYLKRHEYGCAASHHLWEAMEEVSAKPVARMMKIVEVKMKGTRLQLLQRRFTYLENEPEQEWLIPLKIRVFYRNGDSRSITTLLEGKGMEVDVGEDAVACKVNQGQTGFYRVRYLDKILLGELGKRAAGKELLPQDRWGLQSDLYAFVRSGDTSLDEYLGFLGYYSGEDAFLPLTSIARNLLHAYLVMEGKRREKVASVARSLLEKVLSRVGLEPVPGERHTISMLRDQILWHLALYGSEEVLEFATDKLASLMGGGVVHPDITRSVMQVGALNGDARVLEWFEHRLGSSQIEHERMNILAAMGSFGEDSLIRKAQEYVLEKVPARNKFVPLTQMAANPYAIPSMWEWYVSHVQELEQFHPIHYERVIAGIVPLGGMGREEEVREFFQDYMGRKETARDVIKLSLERLEINSRMRNLNS